MQSIGLLNSSVQSCPSNILAESAASAKRSNCQKSPDGGMTPQMHCAWKYVASYGLTAVLHGRQPPERRMHGHLAMVLMLAVNFGGLGIGRRQKSNVR